MASEQILNVVLQDNPLTPETTDFTGRVKSNGTLYNTNIARQIVEQRSEYRYETILGILNIADEIKRHAITSGYHVIDGVMQVRASVNGVFNGEGAQFDSSVHSKSITASASAQLRKSLESSRVVVLGPALTGPIINSVEDMYSATENSLLTPGRNLRIHGRRLRVAGDDPAVVGVWFVSADEASTRIRVDDRDLIDNNPSMLTVVIPALAAGEYFVEVVTQGTANSKVTTKEIRSYRLEMVLTVA